MLWKACTLCIAQVVKPQYLRLPYHSEASGIVRGSSHIPASYHWSTQATAHPTPDLCVLCNDR